eukprot:CCRYP_009691-RA/>CCRYP_009691-RA protein AED:0.45 eAED:0.53 QI:0/0/0/1/1/0.5/2/0/276
MTPSMMSFVSSWPKAKQGGLAIRDPAGAASRLQRASTEATGVLVTSLLEHTTLDIEAHAGCVRQAGAAARRERVEDGKKVVEAMSLRQGPKVKKRLDRMKETGAWLAVIPDCFSGTALSLQEWHDNLSLRYGKTPRGLPRKCDGYGAGFTPWRDHGNRNGNTLGEEAQGDVSAHGFWQKSRSTIFDVRITDTDSKSYGNTASDKLLERFAQLKRDKYEEACLNGAKTSLPCATLWMAWHARPPEQLRGAWRPCYLSSGIGSTLRWLISSDSDVPGC